MASRGKFLASTSTSSPRNLVWTCRTSTRNSTGSPLRSAVQRASASVAAGRPASQRRRIRSSGEPPPPRCRVRPSVAANTTVVASTSTSCCVMRSSPRTASAARCRAASSRPTSARRASSFASAPRGQHRRCCLDLNLLLLHFLPAMATIRRRCFRSPRRRRHEVEAALLGDNAWRIWSSRRGAAGRDGAGRRGTRKGAGGEETSRGTGLGLGFDADWRRRPFCLTAGGFFVRPVFVHQKKF